MSIRPIATIAMTAATLAAALATGSAADASGPRPATHWSASWASAMQQPAASQATEPNWPMQGFSDQTIRQDVRMSGRSSRIRIRLSNLYGTGPLRVAGATVAESAGGAATKPGTMRSLTFRGSRSVTIPAGQVTGSDAADLHVAPLESLTVTLYFAGPTGPATCDTACGGDRRRRSDRADAGGRVGAGGAWRVFAGQLGVLPEPAVQPGAIAIAGALALANLVAALPGLAAARTRPARVLRSE